MKDQDIDCFLLGPEVGQITKLSKVTRWREEKAGRLPKRRQISPNRVAWLESEILAWMESRPVSGISPVASTEKAA